MDSFKNLLRGAIQAKVIVFQIRVGKKPKIIRSDGSMTLDKFSPTSKEQFSSYVESMFPKDVDAIARGRPTKGVLNVVGFGDIKLIVEPKAGSLSGYLPPQGEKLYREEWQRIQAAVNPLESLNSSQTTNHHQDVELGIVADIAPLSIQPSLQPSLQPSHQIPPPPPPVPQAPTFSISPISPKTVSPLTIEVSKDLVEDTIGASLNKVNSEVPHFEFSLGMLASDYGSDVEASKPVEMPSMDAIKLNFDPPSPFKPEPLEEDPDPVVPVIPTLKFDAAPHEGSQSVGLKLTKPLSLLGDDDSELADFSPSLAMPTFSTQKVDELNFGEKSQKSFVTPILSDDKEHQIASMSPISTENPTPQKIEFEAQQQSVSSPVGDFAINGVLRRMVEAGASDCHLTNSQPVVLRIDGDIVRGDEILDSNLIANFIEPIMPQNKRREFLADNDTDFAYEVPGLGRFRVNVFRDRNGVGAVLRLIPSRVISADELSLSPAIRKFCALSKGLVLVTGPTGSGKSTTLAAMIDLINQSRREHILTIEDPIEFVHQQKSCLINQREVHTHTNTFSRALRAALREDPDVVLIGELRDLETIEIALETAETGHLVFGTLHTTTAVSTIDRIIDQFPETQQNQVRLMLAGSLRGVIAQVLVKKKSGGRVAAQEVLVVSKSVAAMIRDAKIHMIPNEMQTKRSEGNTLLAESLVQLIQAGVIEVTEAIKKSSDPDEFREYLKARGLNAA